MDVEGQVTVNRFLHRSQRLKSTFSTRKRRRAFDFFCLLLSLHHLRRGVDEWEPLGEHTVCVSISFGSFHWKRNSLLFLNCSSPFSSGSFSSCCQIVAYPWRRISQCRIVNISDRGNKRKSFHREVSSEIDFGKAIVTRKWEEIDAMSVIAITASGPQQRWTFFFHLARCLSLAHLSFLRSFRLPHNSCRVSLVSSVSFPKLFLSFIVSSQCHKILRSLDLLSDPIPSPCLSIAKSFYELFYRVVCVYLCVPLCVLVCVRISVFFLCSLLFPFTCTSLLLL